MTMHFGLLISILPLILCICCIVLGRVVFVIWRIRRKRASFVWPQKQARSTSQPNDEESSLKTMVVLGSGGHTSEMIQLICNLPPKEYHPIIYVKAVTDQTSLGRVQAAGLLPPSCKVYNIPRAREVGQSYTSSISTTIYAVYYAIKLIASLRPDLIICNGPGTCLPLCVSAFLWRCLGWSYTRIIFVESYCRVENMSLTGRLMYDWVDMCAVHWPNLQTKYPMTQCISTMIRHEKKSL
jgi:beta-1,4-N-acetylglucosaminyltransferase